MNQRLSFEELDEAAKMAARMALHNYPQLHDDIYQEAWCKFLRWPPDSSVAARYMAVHAMRSLIRKDQTWCGHNNLILDREDSIPERTGPFVLGHECLKPRLRQVPRHIRRIAARIHLGVSVKRGRNPRRKALAGKERVQLLRWRRQYA